MSHLIEAGEEMKRAEHLIFVTLKYTRTADVIKNTIKRLISTFDFVILALLEKLRDKERITNIPLTPISRAELLKEKLKRNKDMLDYLELYFLLKLIDKSKFDKREEFRKNVTLILLREKENIEVNMETLRNYYDKTREFLDYSREKYKLK